MQAGAVLWIALAGAVGTALRYAVTVALASTAGSQYPFATLAVNTLGSALLGVVAEVCHGQTLAGVDLRLVIGVGVLGGFTTYSSFNLELLQMLDQGAYGRAAGYFGLTTLGCLGAGAVGIAVGRAVLLGLRA